MWHRKKIKILLVQITNKNYGDSVIADNTRYLLKKAIAKVPFCKYDILDYAINTEDLGQIKFVDAIIFAGGGLVKFRQEVLYRQVSEIIMEAQKHNVPVYLNAVGVEGYDVEDQRCRKLEIALNQSCVKMISVRDDLVCLKEKYMHNSETRIKEVYDPAIWSKNTYRIHRRNKIKEGFIGLGIARDSLFSDYGIPEVDREYLLNLWKKIISILELKGYKWKLFTNGLDQDERFAEQVLKEIGHGEKLEQAINSNNLVHEIAQMDGMIACRMHSNIIAYSLGIPSVGLVWNDKMGFWSKKCNCEERYIAYPELKAEEIVNALENAMREKQKAPSRNEKLSTYNEIQYFVRKFCKKREKPFLKMNISQHLVAAALGGMDFKYKNMNSAEMLKKSLDNGYFYFELDVRMTSDEKLVCVNGWGKGTMKILGRDEQQNVLSSNQFADSQYYHFFSTYTFEQVLMEYQLIAKKNKNIKMILDVGRPERKTITYFYQQMVFLLRKYKISEEQIMIRLQRECDISVFKKQKYNCKMIYFLSMEMADKIKKDVEYEQLIDLCKKNKINMISISNKVWTKEIQKRLRENTLQTIVMSYVKVGDILQVLEEGGQLVASHYYSVNYLKRLLQ